MEIHYILLAVAVLAGLWYYFYVYRKSQAPAAAPAATAEEQYAEEDYAEEEYAEEEYVEEDDDKPKEKSK